MDTIISALISAAAAILVCCFTNMSQAKKTDELLKFKIEELTKQVEKHNDIINRTYKLEEKVSAIDERIKSNAQRINDIKDGTKKGD